MDISFHRVLSRSTHKKTRPSGEAPKKGQYSIMCSPPSATNKSRYWYAIENSSASHALLWFDMPHFVAAFEKWRAQGRWIIVIRLSDGLSGLVEQAALNFGAVTRPRSLLNPHVAVSLVSCCFLNSFCFFGTYRELIKSCFRLLMWFLQGPFQILFAEQLCQWLWHYFIFNTNAAL